MEAQRASSVPLVQPVVADRVAAVVVVVVVVYPDGGPCGDPELQPLGFHLWSLSPPHCRQSPRPQLYLLARNVVVPGSQCSAFARPLGAPS